MEQGFCNTTICYVIRPKESDFYVEFIDFKPQSLCVNRLLGT